MKALLVRHRSFDLKVVRKLPDRLVLHRLVLCFVGMHRGLYVEGNDGSSVELEYLRCEVLGGDVVLLPLAEVLAGGVVDDGRGVWLQRTSK